MMDNVKEVANVNENGKVNKKGSYSIKKIIVVTNKKDNPIDTQFCDDEESLVPDFSQSDKVWYEKCTKYLVDDYCQGCDNKICRPYEKSMSLKENYNIKYISERSDEYWARICDINPSIEKEANRKMLNLPRKDKLCINVLKGKSLENQRKLLIVRQKSNLKPVKMLIENNEISPLVKETGEIVEIDTVNIGMKMMKKMLTYLMLIVQKRLLKNW